MHHRNRQDAVFAFECAHAVDKAAHRLARRVVDADHPAVEGSHHRADVLARRAQAEIDQLLAALGRSEEHTSELQSLMRISYAVFCLKKKNNTTNNLHLTPLT